MPDPMQEFSRLSPTRRELLQRLLQEKLAAKPASPAQGIPRRAELGPVPLSFAQQRLWFLSQFQPESTAYLYLFCWRLSGELSVQALEESLQELVSRHEILRTTFTESMGQPMQVIHPVGGSVLLRIDLQGLKPERREEEALRLTKRGLQSPCDLSNGPLMRTSLLRLEAQEHALLFLIHHIAIDAWSASIFKRELAALYEARIHGEPSPLPPLPIQYADYALWQREWLQKGNLEPQLAYWAKRLEGMVPLELPTDHLRPSVQTFHGEHQYCLLAPLMVEKLRFLSHREGTTLFMTMLATFLALFFRYTGQKDMAVGMTVANRSLPEVEGLIGLFVNELVIRTDLSNDLPFRKLLAGVRQRVIEAIAHQDLPFEELVTRLAPERQLSRSPLFQILFTIHNAFPTTLSLGDLVINSLPIESGTAKFDLSVEIVEKGEELEIELEYNTDLFEASTIQRMIEIYRTLLEGIVGNPEQSLSDLPVLTEATQHQILVEWNATQTHFPQERCIHQFFEQQVELIPDAVALVFEDEILTYETLNRHANHLAHSLRGRGVGPEVLVGLCLERCIEMAVGLLGVFKAGGAYLPLDPSFPASRLRSLLDDAQTTLLLTQSHLSASLPTSQCQCVCLDQEIPSLDTQSASNLSPLTQGENLAYLIYTSGSTGKPKGAMNTHRGICNRLLWMQQTYQLTGSDRVLQKTPLSFDVSVWEFFWPLMTGACLIVASPGGHRDADYLKALLIEQAVTTLHFVPSMLQAFVDELTPQSCGSLRQVMSSGEALSTGLVERFFTRVPVEVQLHNLYGPTEAAIDVTFWHCQRGREQSSMPIGRPIANIQIYLLDRNLQPVPVGVTGELYIGGIGLARGYSRRPDLTAERFIANPFADGADAGARLYRTGDLARYRANGALEYLGRIDHQVKLRGFRVELGEIEATLMQHPSVCEAVVLAREDTPGEKRLVAYVVGKEANLEASGGLRKHCLEKLPEYMVPAFFVLLKTLPLTSNGKVDRRALPAPEGAEEEQSRESDAARTPMEEVLTGLWASVLERRQVGREENFFKLGGHSLLATRLVAQMRAVLGVEVPLRAVFEAPTVALLALRVEQMRRLNQGVMLPPLVKFSRPDPIPLSFAQSRLWFLDQLDPDSPTYLVPAAWRIRGPCRAQVLESSLQALRHRHESLRTTVELRTEQAVQVIHDDCCPLLPVIDLQELGPSTREEVAKRLAKQEAQHPMNLAKGPLLRTSLLRLSSLEYVLLLTLHHIITDSWSNEVLIRELMTLYQTTVSGQMERLSPLPVQYADYALWQQQWLVGEVLERQLAYWRSHLAGVSPLSLPTDYPRPAVQTFRGAYQTLDLPASLVEGLVALSRKAGVTLFMLLLAAFQVLLMRYSGQDDISVGTPIANRTQHEIEGIIGFFVNTLVLRTDLSGNLTFREVLHRVREVALEAYAHQDIPFEKVVEESEPERDLSHSPLFQVMLVLQNVPQERRELVEMSIERLAPEGSVSKFDLTLWLTETRDRLNASLEYRTDLFEAETILRMLTHFQTLLAGIVQDPQARLSDLPLLTQAEREQLLRGWNAIRSEFAQDRCLHQLFAEQVEQTPDSIAVVFEQQQITYQQLNAQASHLASRLIEEGIGPDRLVGVCMERSAELVVALLSVLKAGGAYVPLDPDYPQERLSLMLEDARVLVVLTQESLQDQLTPFGIKTICVGSDVSQTQDHPVSLVQPDNLAYLIYTSGSTGKPKGVMVTHANVIRLFMTTNAWFHFQARESWTFFHSAAFDFSVWEIWGGLLYGGRLVVVPYWMSRSPDEFYQLLIEEQVTILNQTPSAFRQVIRADMREREHRELTLRLVIFGGEALDLRSLRPWLARHGDQCPQLVNMYGITETTVHVTYRPLTHTDGEAHQGSVIGYPLGDLQCYVLDVHRQLVPIGVPGELYVGGEGLARGYWQCADITAERFIPHLFSHKPGARLYRTGDLVRYQATGELEYLGRIDHQVKLRGFRIELGEIEATLMQHPSVREAVVLAREDTPGEKRLVAYVVGERSQVGMMGELRNYLQEQLPGYMVPAFIMLLNALPLSINGKVDHKALPVPQEVLEGEQSAELRERTPIEELIAGFYALVLGRTPIGIHDNFFELGGHSLLATQVISRIRAAIGVEVSVRDLFETPSVEGLARQVERMLRNEQESMRPPLIPRMREQDLLLSFAQQRLWFQEQLASGHSAYTSPLVVGLHGQLHVAVLEKCLQHMVRRHESLRTVFVNRLGKPIQVVHSDLHTELAVRDLRTVEEKKQLPEVLQMLRTELSRPFDLSCAPLMRMGLLRLQEQEHIFYLVSHHIVYDAWSTNIFFRELSMLYEAFLQGKPSPLPPLTLQYADFALWQHGWLKGDVLKTLLDYWTEQLRGVVPLALPVDRERTAAVNNRGAIYPFKLPSQLWQELRALSRSVGVTLFMTLLTAFQILLSRLTGQLDLVVGTDVANRTFVETEQMIGFFVNLLALRLRLNARATFRETVRSVCATVLGAYAHQDLPFEKLVDALRLERKPHQIPLINVLFVLQNVPQQLPELPGLTVCQMDIEIQTAKFDVALFLMERAEEVVGYVNYRADLFSPGTIDHLVRHFEVLLQSIVTSPDIPVEMLEMLTEQEKEQEQREDSMLQEMESHRLRAARRHKVILPPDDSHVS